MSICRGKAIAFAIVVLVAQYGSSPEAARAAANAPVPCRAFTQQQISRIGAALQGTLQSERKSFDMPSIGIALFGCSGLLWVGADGFADQNRSIAAGPDTVFRAGTMTEPLTHMLSRSVRPTDSPRPVAFAEMTSYGAPPVPAPFLEPGMEPSAGPNTTLKDMSSLGSALLAGGAAGGRKIISDGDALGLSVSSLQGHGLFFRDGTAEGFVSKFDLMPEDGIGAIAYSTLNYGSSAERIADYALRVALAVRAAKPVPPNPTSAPLTAAEALPLVGKYRHDRASVMVRWLGDAAYIETPRLAGRLQREPSGYVMDDYVIPMSLTIDPQGRWLDADGIRYIRVAIRRPAPPPSEIVGLLGDYGGDHESIRAFERDGSLFVRIDWIEYDRMARVSRDTWQFPPLSYFHAGERLRFNRDAEGRGTSVVLKGIVLPRYNIIVAPPAQHLTESDRIQLRQRALAASPPSEPPPRRPADLVAISSVDPSIKLDIRYATSHNLLGFPLYPKKAAYLQRPAAEALARADRKLHAQGFGIVVFDAYRPWFVTKMFWDGTPPAQHLFVADPSQGSRHNRGAACDISLVDLATGRELTMTGAFDELSPRSYPRYDGGTSEQRWRRDVLRAALESEGFTVYPYEWWHFDYGDWRSYGILNTEFSKLRQ
jgi:D-alanyl-D-alanine dipeptidase